MSYDSAVRSEYSITTLTSGYVGEENIVNYSPVPRATLERPYVPRAVKVAACASMMIAILRTIYLTASWHFENFALGNALTIANVFLHVILGIFYSSGVCAGACSAGFTRAADLGNLPADSELAAPRRSRYSGVIFVGCGAEHGGTDAPSAVRIFDVPRQRYPVYA